MPFAALGALAALTFAARDAASLALLGWMANQAIGFVFLGYPLDVMTLAWGLALGVSALLSVASARIVLQRVPATGALVRLAIAFLAAWVGQQGTIFAASLVLGGTATAFAPSVLWFILWTNAVTFAGLVALQAIGVRIGLARPPIGQLAG
jgi:hypothetical protein